MDEQQRFSVVCAAADLEAMRKRWRKKLYNALPAGFSFARPLTFNDDGFAWDDKYPLTLHPYRLRAIREALRYEQRAADGNTDWAEALPDKVLKSTDPEIMRVLECWDKTSAPQLPPPPPPPPQHATTLYVNGLTCTTSKWRTALGMSDPEIEAQMQEARVKREAESERLAKSKSAVSAQVVIMTAMSPGARHQRVDMVGCWQKKPCILTQI